MSCPHAAIIHAYHDDELPPPARRSAEIHLAECPACAELLNDLRALSRRISAAPLPVVSDVPFDRYHGAWHVVRQRGVLRISGWLTAAAAAVLVATLLSFPSSSPYAPVEALADAAAVRPSWEPVALMAPVVQDAAGRDEELLAVAQWMAEDLAE
jgi:anti-sigma factor RsiW